MSHIVGTESNDGLWGTADSDLVEGLAGNDTLTDNSGDDTLDGGEGNDRLQDNAGNDTFFGGGGDDYLLNNAGNDVMYGGSGSDQLVDWDGDDYLDGGSGADFMSGGIGNDTYVVDDAGDVISDASGTDLVLSSISYVLGDGPFGPVLENLTLTGSATNGTGNAADNVITGNASNDWLDGGLGVDTLIGGAGDDDYVVDNAGDVTEESADGGYDRVYIYSGVSYTLGAHVEEVQIWSNADVDVTGNDAANVIQGGDGSNVLSGMGGNDYISDNGSADTLYGGDGDDTLLNNDGADVFFGGDGNDSLQDNDGDDVMHGDAGDDWLFNWDGDDHLDGGSGADTMNGGIGNDTYVIDDVGDVVSDVDGIDLALSSITFGLSGVALENLTLTGSAAVDGTGSSVANLIIGNAAANVLNGNGGADTLAGGGGDDTYIVDEASVLVIEDPGEGIDAVHASLSWTLDANLENLMLAGTSAINGTGNSLDNVLAGNSANNTLAGGAGNDRYFVQNAGDVVVENSGEGTDVLNTSLTTTLGANLEGLVLTGAANVNGTGNALANLVSGNSGANTLNGGAGFDALEGGGGADVLTDTSGATYFNGGAGNDTLTGGSARDFFMGSAGNDLINTGNGADVIVFNVGDGRDTINASSGIDDTLSLGGSGITYSDLTFQKVGKDLVLSLNGSDSITFKNWYQGNNNETVLNLQVVTEAMDDYDPNSGNPLLDEKIETFNFQGLVDAFDAARAADHALTTWALSNALSQQHTGGSDSSAYGGSLAYLYGVDGTLAGLDFDAAQNVMSVSIYGTQLENFLIGDPYGGIMSLG